MGLVHLVPSHVTLRRAVMGVTNRGDSIWGRNSAAIVAIVNCFFALYMVHADGILGEITLGIGGAASSSLLREPLP